MKNKHFIRAVALLFSVLLCVVSGCNNNAAVSYPAFSNSSDYDCDIDIEPVVFVKFGKHIYYREDRFFKNENYEGENDAIKNSISGMALNFYSHNELQNKNSDEKIHMMRMKGHCFYEDTDPAFMRGTFYHRENYLKELSDKEVSRIPEAQRCSNPNLVRGIDGSYSCWRSRIEPMFLPYRLTETEDLESVLFHGYFSSCKIENPTFDLSKRGEMND